jgi:hypothetical protein
MEIDDEIEEEIDIIYSGEFQNEVNLFQFPLIPKDNLKTQNFNTLSINKEHSSMKLDVNIDPQYLDNRAYNFSKTQTMKGEKIDSNTNLCIGIFKNGKLFLTPISNVYQFRHDFSSFEKDITIKKKDKKDFRNNMIIEKENLNLEYIPYQLFQPNTIDSNQILKKITNIDYSNKYDNLLNKEQYYDLLLKNIVDETVTGDYDIPIEDNYFDNNNKNINNNQISNNYNTIDTKNNQNKDDKDNKDEFIDINFEKKNKSVIGNIIENTINNIFANYDCLFYGDLLELICNELNIDLNDDENVKKIRNEISNVCLVIKDKYCFLKNIDDENNDIRLKLIDYISKEDGVKKQQIKNYLKENNLNIQESKLNKLMKTFSEYSNSVSVIKTHSKIH